MTVPSKGESRRESVSATSWESGSRWISSAVTPRARSFCSEARTSIPPFRSIPFGIEIVLLRRDLALEKALLASKCGIGHPEPFRSRKEGCLGVGELAAREHGEQLSLADRVAEARPNLADHPADPRGHMSHPVAVDLDLAGKLGGHREAARPGGRDLDPEGLEVGIVDANHLPVGVPVALILPVRRLGRFRADSTAREKKNDRASGELRIPPPGSLQS